MADKHDNLISKEVCDHKSNEVREKIIDLKANIHTSKESLGNRLDKVDLELQKALLGDVGSPGGLCGTVSELKRDIEEARKDWIEHKNIIDDKVKTQNFRMKLCFILLALIIGGKFLGFGISTVMDYMRPPIKPTPITAPAPIEETDNSVPTELKVLIQEIIEQQSNQTNNHIDIPADKADAVPSSLLETEEHDDGHKDIPMATVNEIISSTEENK